MYSVRLYNDDYSDNQWYQNGGCYIINDLMQDENKYGLKFFHCYPYPDIVFKDFYKDNNFETRSLEPIPIHMFSCSRQDSFFTSTFRYYTETSDLALWGVFNPIEINPLLKDIFKIKPIGQCPFLIGAERNLTIIKQTEEYPFTEIDLQYLNDFCFDHIGDKYFLMSQFDIEKRKKYLGKELLFNKPSNYLFHIVKTLKEEELTWMKLKFTQEEQNEY